MYVSRQVFGNGLACSRSPPPPCGSPLTTCSGFLRKHWWIRPSPAAFQTALSKLAEATRGLLEPAASFNSRTRCDLGGDGFSVVIPCEILTLFDLLAVGVHVLTAVLGQDDVIAEILHLHLLVVFHLLSLQRPSGNGDMMSVTSHAGLVWLSGQQSSWLCSAASHR